MFAGIGGLFSALSYERTLRQYAEAMRDEYVIRNMIIRRSGLVPLIGRIR